MSVSRLARGQGEPQNVLDEFENSRGPGDSPPWQRRGGRDINKSAAKPPLLERTGWFVQRPIIGGLNQPPPLRQLMRLRAILLLAQPPLLGQGGDWLDFTPLFVG